MNKKGLYLYVLIVIPFMHILHTINFIYCLFIEQPSTSNRQLPLPQYR